MGGLVQREDGQRCNKSPSDRAQPGAQGGPRDAEERQLEALQVRRAANARPCVPTCGEKALRNGGSTAVRRARTKLLSRVG